MKGNAAQFDPVTRRLLLTVIQSGQREAYPALMDADNLAWEAIVPIAVGEAQWLNPLNCRPRASSPAAAIQPPAPK